MRGEEAMEAHFQPIFKREDKKEDEYDEFDDRYDEDDEEEDEDPAERKVNDLAYQFLSTETQHFFINPEIRAVFGEKENWESIVAASPLTLPRGLDNVISGVNAPPPSFFASLPQPLKGKDNLTWGVYALLYTKQGEAPKLYIGLGTSADQGVMGRLQNYHQPGREKISPRIVAAEKKGYKLAHSGLLASTPVLIDVLRPRVRARILILETLFTVWFHACQITQGEAEVVEFYLWPRESVAWGHLCTHQAVQDYIRGDLSLTPQERDIVAAVRTTAAQRYVARQRAKDPDAFHKRNRELTQGRRDRDSKRINEQQKKAKQAIKDSGRFTCNHCNQSFSVSRGLENHKESQKHKNALAGIKKVTSTRESNKVARQKLARKRIIEEKKFYCPTCDISSSSAFKKRRHDASKRHLAKVAKAQAAIGLT